MSGLLHTSIDRANEVLTEALSRGDAGGMAGCYTAQAELLPPGSEAVSGHEGIREFWSAVIGAGIASARLETVELDGRGDTAIEVGRYSLGTADGAVADEGKYLVVWKRENGAWKLHRDIWNTSRG